MASLVPEVEAFADVRAKVQSLVADSGGALWDSAPSYDRADVPAFLDQLLPLLESGQRQAVALTDAFVAKRMERPAFGIDPRAVIAGIRGDVTPEEVYSRPFRELWWGVSQGKLWDVSARAARARLLAALRTDVLLATTHAMVAIAKEDSDIAGYSRVVRGTCDLCEEAKGEVTGGVILQPIHPGCECVGDPRRSVPATRKNATVGTRVHTVVGSEEKVGPTGVITKTRKMTSGQGFDVKVKFDPIPEHPIRAVREGANEKWISNPGLNLRVIESPEKGASAVEKVMTPEQALAGRAEHLSAADLRSMEMYVGSDTSFDINEVLRGTYIPGMGKWSEEELRSFIFDIDQTMEAQGSFGVTIKAFRGLPLDDVPGTSTKWDQAVGKTFTDHGFGSTSSSEQYAEEFVVPEGEKTPYTVLEMNIDPRVRGVWGANSAEKELVLERDCRYVVKSAKKEGSKWHVQIDVLPPEHR